MGFHNIFFTAFEFRTPQGALSTPLPPGNLAAASAAAKLGALRAWHWQGPEFKTWTYEPCDYCNINQYNTWTMDKRDTVSLFPSLIFKFDGWLKRIAWPIHNIPAELKRGTTITRDVNATMRLRWFKKTIDQTKHQSKVDFDSICPYVAMVWV